MGRSAGTSGSLQWQSRIGKNIVELQVEKDVPQNTRFLMFPNMNVVKDLTTAENDVWWLASMTNFVRIEGHLRGELSERSEPRWLETRSTLK